MSAAPIKSDEKIEDDAVLWRRQGLKRRRSTPSESNDSTESGPPSSSIEENHDGSKIVEIVKNEPMYDINFEVEGAKDEPMLNESEDASELAGLSGAGLEEDLIVPIKIEAVDDPLTMEGANNGNLTSGHYAVCIPVKQDINNASISPDTLQENESLMETENSSRRGRPKKRKPGRPKTSEKSRVEQRCDANRRYRQAHPEVARNAQKRYAAKHPEVHRAAVKRYAAKHPEVHRAAVKRYADKHREVHRAAVKRYADKHPEVHQPAVKRYELKKIQL